MNCLLAFCLQNGTPPDLDGAIRYYTAAAAIHPDDAIVHFMLGHTLLARGRPSEAILELRTGVRLWPEDFNAHHNLGAALEDRGMLDEAVKEYQTAMRLDPKSSYPHGSLGELLAVEGKTDEAVAEFQTAMRLNPKDGWSHYGLARVYVKDANYPAALTEFQTCQDLVPAAAPDRALAVQQARGVQAALRLEPKLDAVLSGKEKPADAAEGVGLACMCMAKKRYAASARLFADAFSMDPHHIDVGSNRSLPAHAAALAGCGLGADADRLTEAKRSRWRKQALSWLRADLDVWIREGAPGLQNVQSVWRWPPLWLYHVDFAGVRDEAELKKLPEDEQTAWRQFWADVTAAVNRAEQP